MMAGIEAKGTAISTQDWMGELKNQIGDEPLTRIKMPGAHDSATASIGYKSKIQDNACQKPFSEILLV